MSEPMAVNLRCADGRPLPARLHVAGRPVAAASIAPQDVGAERIGHLGFFHRSHRDTLWAQAAAWMRGVAQRAGERRAQVA